MAKRNCGPLKKFWGGTCICKFGRVKKGARKGQCRKSTPKKWK